MVDLPSASVEIEIPFHDIDVMEVAWHGHYAKYFEIARCALPDKIGYNYREMRESGYSWPVIELKVRYMKPARYGQRIRVEARLAEYEIRLKLDYRVTDAETGERLTKGYTVQVAVDMAAKEMLLSSPTILYQKLGFLP
jgi:acyl-CoA thioester hydrolase